MDTNEHTGFKIRWRRVFAVLAAFLLVTGLVLILLSGLGGGRPERGDDVILPDGTFDLNAGRDAEANKPVECSAEQLEVLALTDKTSYGPGEHPQFALSVENKGVKPCYKNLGTKNMIFEVQTGALTVWLSSHCQKMPDDRYVLLEPGQKLTTAKLVWDRTKSTESTCETQRETVVAQGASYHLLVAVGGVPAQQSAQFLLY